MGSKSRRPAPRQQRPSTGPGRVAPGAPGMIDSGYAEAPMPGLQLGQPTQVMRSWAANSQGQMEAQGPWQQAPAPGGAAEELARAAALQQAVDLAADDPQLQPFLHGQQLPAGATLDPEAMFGTLQADPLDPDVSELAGGWDSEDPTTPEGSTGSSPLAPTVLKLRGKAFAKIAAAVFEAVSGLLNERLALHEEDETWLADEQDKKMVGEPAGRLMARHAPLPGGTDASDLSDIIEIGIGTAGYLIKNSMQRARLRRALRRATVPAA